MTKPIATTKKPRVGQTSRPAMNSILAAASTAHDLDAAHRKAAKANALHRHRGPDNQLRPIMPIKRRDETLFQFVMRLGHLVATQIRERGKR
jgi:hypothetical protein